MITTQPVKTINRIYTVRDISDADLKNKLKKAKKRVTEGYGNGSREITRLETEIARRASEKKSGKK